MIITTELDLKNFAAWSGAVDTKNVILENNKAQHFELLMEELYPDGMTDTHLNDILWFEEDWIFEMLGINQDEEEDEEE
jgi:hypothetical protein